MSSDRLTDEALLIDYLRGECDEAQAGAVKARLEADGDFARLHDQLREALAALGSLPPVEPPADLADRTLERIRAAQQTDRLLAREQLKHRHRAIPATFSFRELVALAASIIVLAAVIVPGLHHARQLRTAELCAAQLGQVGQSLTAYAAANDSYLPAAAGRTARWLPAKGEASVSNSAGLFKLVRAGYAPPTRFQCPAVGGGAFAVQAGMVDFPASDFVSYSYQHSLGANALRLGAKDVQHVRDKMAILADSTPLFRDGRFLADRVRATAGDNHKRRGQNVLYLDMHTDWATTPNVGVDGNNIYLAEGVYRYTGEETPNDATDTFLLPAYSGQQMR